MIVRVVVHAVASTMAVGVAVYEQPAPVIIFSKPGNLVMIERLSVLFERGHEFDGAGVIARAALFGRQNLQRLKLSV